MGVLSRHQVMKKKHPRRGYILLSVDCAKRADEVWRPQIGTGAAINSVDPLPLLPLTFQQARDSSETYSLPQNLREAGT